jgi:hypothetical protein
MANFDSAGIGPKGAFFIGPKKPGNYKKNTTL